MTKVDYDSSDPQSIESYASKLLHRSLRGYLLGKGQIPSLGGKGKLGQYLEKHFFGYEPNSIAGPDFAEAGVELKTSPMKQTSKGLRAKERLVLNIIDYMKEHEKTFHTGSFYRKNSHLLLMFFLYERNVEELDYIFKIVRLWKFPEVDLEIIKNDWERIVAKIREGKAHEISEGDTMYLAASTKGANAKSLRAQPFSDKMAMQRAFSLKPKYLNYIISQSLELQEFKDAEPVVKSKAELRHMTFEELVESRFQPYFGKTENEIAQMVGATLSNAKHSAYILCKNVLGVKGKRIEEFEKAGLLLKTVVLDRNGNLKEAMSFKQIRWDDLADQEWEDSDLFETLSKRFLFVVFQKDIQGRKILKSVKFWGMPFSDLQKAKAVWLDTREKVRRGKFDGFVKSSDDHVLHVRPKAKNKADVAQTRFGPVEKKSFWLNRPYIHRILTIIGKD